MGTLSDITAWAVGTNGEALQTSNSGFTKNPNVWGGSLNGDIKVTNVNGTPTTAYGDPASPSSVSGGYMHNVAPASTTHYVEVVLRRAGAGGNNGRMRILGHGDTSTTTWISLDYEFATGYLTMSGKVAGTSQTTTNFGAVAGLVSAGDEATLRLALSGAAGAIVADAYWNGTKIGSSTTYTNASYPSLGLLGFQYHQCTNISQTAGVHVKAFKTWDDTGDSTLPTQTGVVTASAVTASSATISWPAGSDNVAVTGYEYSINGGSYTAVGNVLSTGLTGLPASTLHNVSVRCFDAAGNRSTPAITGSFTTSAGSTPVAFSGTVPAQTGTVGTASTALALAGYFSGSLTPFSYSVFSGALPPGLSLNASTGQITGTPTTAGSYSAVVRATDTGSNTANTGTIAWTIAAAAATALNLTVAAAAGVTGLSGVVLSAAAPGAGVSVLKTITAAAFDGAGAMSIDITGLGVTVGQRRWVALTQSNGDPAQSPAPWGASGPVTAS